MACERSWRRKKKRLPHGHQSLRERRRIACMHTPCGLPVACWCGMLCMWRVLWWVWPHAFRPLLPCSFSPSQAPEGGLPALLGLLPPALPCSFLLLFLASLSSPCSSVLPLLSHLQAEKPGWGGGREAGGGCGHGGQRQAGILLQPSRLSCPMTIHMRGNPSSLPSLLRERKSSFPGGDDGGPGWPRWW